MINVLIIFSEAIMPLDIIFWKVFKSASKCKQLGRIGTKPIIIKVGIMFVYVVNVYMSTALLSDK